MAIVLDSPVPGRTVAVDYTYTAGTAVADLIGRPTLSRRRISVVEDDRASAVTVERMTDAGRPQGLMVLTTSCGGMMEWLWLLDDEPVGLHDGFETAFDDSVAMHPYALISSRAGSAYTSLPPQSTSQDLVWLDLGSHLHDTNSHPRLSACHAFRRNHNHNHTHKHCPGACRFPTNDFRDHTS